MNNTAKFLFDWRMLFSKRKEMLTDGRGVSMSHASMYNGLCRSVAQDCCCESRIVTTFEDGHLWAVALVCQAIIGRNNIGACKYDRTA